MSSLFFTLCFTFSLFISINCQTGKCGIINKKDDRIVGGREINYLKYPWFAAFVLATNQKNLVCGGTLISKRYIITAAHCYKPFFKKHEDGEVELEEIYLIKLGITNVCVNEPDQQIFDVEKVIIHDKYYGDLLYYDIAIVKLKDDVNDFMPICLPNGRYESNNRTGLVGSVIGLGKESATAWRLPCAIKEAEVELQTDTSCRNMLTANKEKGERAVDVFCAGNYNGGVDTCQGDSGGPLQITVGAEETRVLLGITSFGFSCAKPKTYGVYTDVSHYLQWILTNTRDSLPLQATRSTITSSNSPNSASRHTVTKTRQRKPARNIFQQILNL